MAKIIGITEKIIVYGKNKKQKTIVARIDTGAKVSSIDKALSRELKLGPILRTKIVKNANGRSERNVVPCKLRLAGKIFKTEVTIADRSHLRYNMLIGQNLLKGTGYLIDPKRSFDYL